MFIKRSPQEFDEAREPLSLTVEISDFGPINSGEITLKPLTVFIGPNNSGKSYAAMLINSIFAPQPDEWHSFPEDILTELSLHKMPDALRLQYELHKFIAEAMKLEEEERITVPQSLLDRLADTLFQHFYARFLLDQITRSHGCEPADLIAIDRGEFVLRLNADSNETHLRYDGQRISVDKRPDLSMLPLELIARSEQGVSRPIYFMEDEYSGTVTVDIPRHQDFIEEVLCKFVWQEYVNVVWPGQNRRSYYLPAARCGILQAHKTLAAAEAAFYEQFQRHLEIPQLPGVVDSFISTLQQLDPERRSRYFQTASTFERLLLNGRTGIGHKDNHRNLELLYSYRDIQMPLHRTSSTVSELAPLFLYLKHVVGRGSLLIIEEPEAHLHPANQRILAQLLVRLIREGLTVLITTHSEFLLEQLSNFTLLSKLDPETRRSYDDYGENDYLKMDEVAVYLFRPESDEREGYVIKSVEIDEEDGISQTEFVKVHKALYQETLHLYHDLSDDDDDNDCASTDEP